jgi:transcriptional regulator with XRE-family HTH domain
MLVGFPHQTVKYIVNGSNPVKVYREYRKMTQEELAKKAGVSVSMIRKIENGESEGSISTIKAIAKGRFPHIFVLKQT